MRNPAAMLLLPLLLLARPSIAGPPDRSAGFRALAADFPAPGPEGAYVFSGEIVVGGEVLGTFYLSAAATREDGEPRWQVRSTTATGSGAAASRTGEDVWLTPRLAAVRGRGEAVGPRGKKTWSFARVPEGFRCEPGGEVFPHPADAVSSLAALLLFCRLAIPEEETCRTPFFDAGADGGPKVVEAELVLSGGGDFRGREAFLVRGRRGEAELLFAFDPATKLPIGARIRYAAQNLEMMLLPPGSGREPLPADFFDRPARTPAAAAARGALAILCGDAKLAERAFDWPALYTAYRKASPDSTVGFERYREGVLAKLAAAPGLRPRGEMEAVLRALYGSLLPEAAGEGRARIRFAKPLEYLVIEVAETGGEWRLTAIPPAR